MGWKFNPRQNHFLGPAARPGTSRKKHRPALGSPRCGSPGGVLLAHFNPFRPRPGPSDTPAASGPSLAPRSGPCPAGRRPPPPSSPRPARPSLPPPRGRRHLLRLAERGRARALRGQAGWPLRARHPRPSHAVPRAAAPTPGATAATHRGPQVSRVSQPFPQSAAEWAGGVGASHRDA